jgi:hypothetical protein
MKTLNTVSSSLVLALSFIGASALLLAPAHPRAQQVNPGGAGNAGLSVRGATPLGGACGQTITTPGTYILTADIGASAPCPGDGIDIAVSNVKLMLNGHAITGNGGASYNNFGSGITICATPPSCQGTGRLNNIQVQGNGLIQQFGGGVYLQNIDNSEIQQIVMTSNFEGIGSTHSTNLQLTRNVVTTSLYGIYVYLDASDDIQRNELAGNSGGSGVTVQLGGDNQIHDNNVSGGGSAGVAGILVQSSSGNEIFNNNLLGNAGGIFIFNQYATSGNNSIRNNASEGNFYYDLLDDNASCGTNVWKNNTFFSANRTCIH